MECVRRSNIRYILKSLLSHHETVSVRPYIEIFKSAVGGKADEWAALKMGGIKIPHLPENNLVPLFRHKTNFARCRRMSADARRRQSDREFRVLKIQSPNIVNGIRVGGIGGFSENIFGLE